MWSSVLSISKGKKCIGGFHREERLQFAGQPLRHYKAGDSAQLVMCGVMVFLFGRSCHSVIDLTGSGTTITYVIK